MVPASRRSKKVSSAPFTSATCNSPASRAAWQGLLQALLPYWSSPLTRGLLHRSADLLSALDFDETGDYLATGDRGGRIVVFERTATDKVLWP